LPDKDTFGCGAVRVAVNAKVHAKLRAAIGFTHNLEMQPRATGQAQALFRRAKGGVAVGPCQPHSPVAPDLNTRAVGLCDYGQGQQRKDQRPAHLSPANAADILTRAHEHTTNAVKRGGHSIAPAQNHNAQQGGQNRRSFACHLPAPFLSLPDSIRIGTKLETRKRQM
jgi:hypothetical protein